MPGGIEVGERERRGRRTEHDHALVLNPADEAIERLALDPLDRCTAGPRELLDRGRQFARGEHPPHRPGAALEEGPRRVQPGYDVAARAAAVVRIYSPGGVGYPASGDPMGRTLHRYLFVQILAPFAAGLALFTFVLLIARIMKLVELVVNRGVPALDILRVFSYILPAFLEVTVPMALLLACLMACGRLSADSEFTALRASGVSLYQFAQPFAAFAVAIWLVSMTLSIWVRPMGNAGLKQALFELARTRASAGLKEHVFNDEFKGLVIYVDHIEPPGTELRHILISDRRRTEEQNTVIARSGTIVSNEAAQTLSLRLREGTIFSAGEDAEGGFHKTDFNAYDVSLNLAEALGQFDGRKRDPSELATVELRERIRELAGRGEKSFEERAELHRRFAVPFAAIVFALLGVSLGLQPVRAIRSRGLALSLAVILAYYVLLSAGETLGERGRLPVAFALWLPNIVLGLVGAALLRREARERPLGIERTWARLLDAIRSRATAPGRAT